MKQLLEILPTLLLLLFAVFVSAVYFLSPQQDFVHVSSSGLIFQCWKMLNDAVMTVMGPLLNPLVLDVMGWLPGNYTALDLRDDRPSL